MFNAHGSMRVELFWVQFAEARRPAAMVSGWLIVGGNSGRSSVTSALTGATFISVSFARMEPVSPA
jgi:hypothetical protein